MNPSTQTTQKTGPTLVRDASPTNSINAEIVDDIPVRNPLGSDPAKQPLKSPAAQVFKPSAKQPETSDDEELDHILRDVNSSVKQSEDSADARFEHLSGVRKKAAAKKAKLDQKHRGSPPVIATIAACLVALALTAAAFMVYRNGS